MRFQVGDTDTNAQLISDEEISAVLTQQGSNVYKSAAAVADALSSKFARLANTAIESLSVDFGTMAENYRKLAARLRADASAAAAMSVGAFVGGVSRGAMASVDSNSDKEPSRIRVGFTDFDSVQGLDENP